jgi:hypothetical protein
MNARLKMPTLSAAISPPFAGWLQQFGCNARPRPLPISIRKDGIAALTRYRYVPWNVPASGKHRLFVTW